MRKYAIVALVCLTSLCVTGFSVLHSDEEKQPFENPSSGEELARIYCVSCHIFPDPSLLDKTTWKEHVLPNMGWRLGIRKAGEDPYADLVPDEAVLVKALKVYPDKPLLKKEQWQQIVAYYLQQAPDAPLPQKSPLAFDHEMEGFHAQAIFIGKKAAPKTCMVKFDSARGLLFLGDASNKLYAVRSNLKLLASWNMQSAPVDMDFIPGKNPRVLCIGSIMPSQKKEGKLISLESDTTSDVGGLQNLARPVQFTNADLNGDGVQDLIVCQFGNHTGKLCWYESSNPNAEHVLRLQPGARKVEVQDMNGDGKPDIVALMAQAMEGLFLYTNEGDGKFSESELVRFPPVYGVSFFELHDFNNDGHPDILVTNGDNWDMSQIRKYYHGIRIFLNDGKNNFKETLFFPYYGASKAMAYDFDNDGDLDIAAISFYDDPEKPEQSFIYMENTGNLNFSVSSTEVAASGKWLTMDIGDLDHDGDMDIFLGSYIQSMGELSKLLFKGVETFPQTIVLWNDLHPSPEQK